MPPAGSSENAEIVAFIVAGAPISDDLVGSIHHAQPDVDVLDACVVASDVDVIAHVRGKVEDLGEFLLNIMTRECASRLRRNRALPHLPPHAVRPYFVSPMLDRRPAEPKVQAYVDIELREAGLKEAAYQSLAEEMPDSLLYVGDVLNRSRLLALIGGDDADAVTGAILEKIQNIPLVASTRTYLVMKRPDAGPPPEAKDTKEGVLQGFLFIRAGAAHRPDLVASSSTEVAPLGELVTDEVMVCSEVDVIARINGTKRQIGKKLLETMSTPAGQGLAPPRSVQVYLEDDPQPHSVQKEAKDLEAYVAIDLHHGAFGKTGDRKKAFADHLRTWEKVNVVVHSVHSIWNRPRILARVSATSTFTLSTFIEMVQRHVAGESRIVESTVTHIILRRLGQDLRGPLREFAKAAGTFTPDVLHDFMDEKGGGSVASRRNAVRDVLRDECDKLSEGRYVYRGEKKLVPRRRR